MTIIQAFETFRQKIEPTTYQKDAVKRSLDNMRSYLTGLSSPNIYKTRIFGSHQRNTKIRPLDDVDLLALIDASPYQTNWSFNAPQPRSIIANLRNKLKQQFPQTTIRQDRPCLVVEFNLHRIEIVPAFEISNGNFYIPDEDLINWKETNIVSLENKVSTTNNRNSMKLVPLVKMIKKWRDENSVSSERMLSYRIEEILCEMFPGYSSWDTIDQYYNALHKWFQKFASNNVWKGLGIVTGAGFGFQKYGTVGGVAGGVVGKLVGDFVTDLLKSSDQDDFDNAYQLSTHALNAIDNNQYDLAKQYYRELFGYDFPTT